MTASADAASLPGGNTVLVEITDRVAWVTMKPVFTTLLVIICFPLHHQNSWSQKKRF